jgi:hypothetical protein
LRSSFAHLVATAPPAATSSPARIRRRQVNNRLALMSCRRATIRCFASSLHTGAAGARAHRQLRQGRLRRFLAPSPIVSISCFLDTITRPAPTAHYPTNRITSKGGPRRARTQPQLPPRFHTVTAQQKARRGMAG